MFRRTLSVPVVFLVVVLISAWPMVQLQDTLDRYRSQVTAEESLLYLPSGRFLSTAVLGYDNFVADLMWARGISLFGERFQMVKDNEWFSWLFQIVDLATDLDPFDVRIYKYGGLMLRLNPKGVDQSTYIFHKGLAHVPDEFFLPFGIAMNYLESKNDPERAAEYMRRASICKNAPFYLRNLAASLMDDTDQQDAAIAFLEEQLKELKPGTLQYNAAYVKVLEVRHNAGARRLLHAMGQFLSIYDRTPSPLKEMEGITWKGQWPEDPFGGEYTLIPRTGVLRSSLYAQTMESFRRNYGLGAEKSEEDASRQGVHR